MSCAGPWASSLQNDWAKLMVRSVSDNFEDGTLGEFIAKTDDDPGDEMRRAFPRSVGWWLHQVANPFAEGVWERWIDAYFTGRLLGIPRLFGELEAGEMLDGSPRPVLTFPRRWNSSYGPRPRFPRSPCSFPTSQRRKLRRRPPGVAGSSSRLRAVQGRRGYSIGLRWTVWWLSCWASWTSTTVRRSCLSASMLLASDARDAPRSHHWWSHAGHWRRPGYWQPLRWTEIGPVRGGRCPTTNRAETGAGDHRAPGIPRRNWHAGQ